MSSNMVAECARNQKEEATKADGDPVAEEMENRVVDEDAARPVSQSQERRVNNTKTMESNEDRKRVRRSYAFSGRNETRKFRKRLLENYNHQFTQLRQRRGA